MHTHTHIQNLQTYNPEATSTKAANLPENKNKNRYPDALPCTCSHTPFNSGLLSVFFPLYLPSSLSSPLLFSSLSPPPMHFQMTTPEWSSLQQTVLLHLTISTPVTLWAVHGIFITLSVVWVACTIHSQIDVDPMHPKYIATQGPLQNTVSDFWQVCDCKPRWIRWEKSVMVACIWQGLGVK